MIHSKQLRDIVKLNLPGIVKQLNLALSGQNLTQLKPTLARFGKNKQLPHWFEQLQKTQSLPNLDGKTIGSVIEMLFVAILETTVFSQLDIRPLQINPAKGVDIPELELGIKSPSTNFSTSEPFFSAYDRLLGNEYDIIVLLTDYQIKKKTPPLQLQITQAKYLYGSQIADFSLCTIARENRTWLLESDINWARKIFKFLAFVNQSDWQAKQLVRLIRAIQNPNEILMLIEQAQIHFNKTNKRYQAQDKALISEQVLQSLLNIKKTTPIALGVVFAADAWVENNHQDFARSPNANEWKRLLNSPLDGQIGMSFALQWRYNFSHVFRSSLD